MREFEKFEIIEIEPMGANSWGFLALVNIRFGPLVVRGFRLTRSKDGKKVFCGLPVLSFRDHDGLPKKKTMVWIPEDFKEKIFTEILTRWTEFENLKFNRRNGD